MGMLKKKFHIIDMHCTSCAMSIDLDLEDLAGVKESKTNYAKQVSEVTYDPGIVSEKEIIAQIKKTGYNVQETKVV